MSRLATDYTTAFSKKHNINNKAFRNSTSSKYILKTNKTLPSSESTQNIPTFSKVFRLLQEHDFTEVQTNLSFFQILNFKTSLYSKASTIYEERLAHILQEAKYLQGFAKITYGDCIYVGHLDQNQTREGQGLFLFRSKDVYWGDWRNNKLHGYGSYLFSNGQLYEGELKDNMKSGHGCIHYKNKTYYEGSWINNKKQGLGSVVYNNGKVFVGLFFGDRKISQGVLVDENGRQKYCSVPVEDQDDSEDTFSEQKHIGESSSDLKQGQLTVNTPFGPIRGRWNDGFLVQIL